jgi:starch synthase
MTRRKASARRANRSILMIGSEAVPFSKTGGLGDVLGALPSALARLGWDVTLALPRYRGTPAGRLLDTFPVTVGGYTRDVAFRETELPEGARALLIDCPDLFDRESLYVDGGADYPDNARRFAMLARAALEFSARRGASATAGPDLVHGHDWQAGLAPVYLRTLYAEHPVLANTPTVFTIHNLAFQGLFAPAWLPRLDLPRELFGIDQLEFWGRISFLKGGINFADVITTVSPRYADEIQTPQYGCGFDGILRRRGADLVGILNGINTETWDPSRDPHLPTPYDTKNLAGKADAKAAVLRRFGLPGDPAILARPAVAMISRMVDQKGLDLIAALADELPRLDATFIVLGTGEARYEQMWKRLAAAHPDRIGVEIGFDEGLAHLIEGGADIFLMPSQFEPCGLSQLYSLRYGTVPVVRFVGGLADTVLEAAPRATPKGTRGRKPSDGTGFVFHDYTPAALLEALQRALSAFAHPRTWRALQLAGMARDHSWDRSAREYVTIYERVLAKRARTR